MNHDLYVWLAVAVIALVTAATRFAPFLLFGKRKTPKAVAKLGRMLPCAIMGMLVVYCLKDTEFTNAAGFLPEVIACLIVGVIYIRSRNTLLSIVTGTVCYMMLVQKFF